jgi:hypothetical protein
MEKWCNGKIEEWSNSGGVEESLKFMLWDIKI